MAYSGVYTLVATEVLQTLHPGATGLCWSGMYTIIIKVCMAEEISHLHNWVIEVFFEVSARTITWIISLDPQLLC